MGRKIVEKISLKILLLLYLLLALTTNLNGYTCKFTKLECLVLDDSVVGCQHCEIKAAGRNDNFIRIHVIMKEVVRSTKVNINLMKRENGWKPFLYNITFDGCKFLKNPLSNPIANFFYSILRPYTNMNHSCPIAHDIIIEDFRIPQENVRLPFPHGEYLINNFFIINHKNSIRINFACKHVD